MNITCLIDHLGPGGAQRQLVTLACGFRERGHEVTLITYSPANFYLPILKQYGIEHVLLTSRSKMERVHLIRRQLRSMTHDVVLAFLQTPVLLAELSSLPTRTWRLVVSERQGQMAFTSLRARLLRQLHCVADAITTNAEATERLLRTEIPRLVPRIHVVYNALNSCEFYPGAASTFSAHKRRTVVVAASYSTRKNIHGLISALTSLDKAATERLRIHWYGERYDNTFQSALDAVQKHSLSGVLRLHKATTDIGSRMRAADAVGLFSFSEGLPNCVCEGMACAKPIIISDVGDASSLIENGVNGWLCDPHDASSVADALNAFTHAPPQLLAHMGRSNREKAMTLFNPSTIVTQYLDIFSKTLIYANATPR